MSEADYRIDAGCAPGGLVVHLVVDGEVVDAAELVEETSHITERVAVRHYGAAVAATARGDAVEVRIFDGDSGALVMVMRP
jgi:hypothetical protein